MLLAIPCLRPCFLDPTDSGPLGNDVIDRDALERISKLTYPPRCLEYQ
ncbi:hypothetical protein SAMN04488094_10389 [Tropicimonas isoalkanivorans]|uniref:Uncharacterized protein n=1 Tax=Tropicimonas isoalkanivorans TaxID=441112 RepID=A0A1I1HBD5_9RHOB|nr:hypothetical protein SAMN04488094_10389 [Tropicimonas isoalkanivorans]